MTEPGTRGTIPLFPLGSVLFPGLLLPLNIFEPRYRTLVADLEGMADDDRRFGVVCIREGVEVGETGIRALHQVGCTAEVHRITTDDDGRSEVVSVGGHRFVLLDVDHDAHPYATATWSGCPKRRRPPATTRAPPTCSSTRSWPGSAGTSTPCRTCAASRSSCPTCRATPGR